MPSEAPTILFFVVCGLISAHLFAARTRTWVWKVLLGLGVVMFGIQAWLGLVWAPPEQAMGDVYRIIYMHVPQVWMSLAAFALNFGCAVAYLWKKSMRADALAEASAEVGLYFGTLGVTLGAIWAKPTWGVWWDWDPRLITAAIMVVIYAGYLAMRQFAASADSRATGSAVIAVLAFVDLPVLWFSVKWWNSLHQAQSSKKDMAPEMHLVLNWSAVAFCCLLFVFIYQRYRVALSRQQFEFAPPPVAGAVS